MALVLALALSLVCGRWGWRVSRSYALKAAYHADQRMSARLALTKIRRALTIMQKAPPSILQARRRAEARTVSARIMSALASRPGSKDLLTVWVREPKENDGELSAYPLQLGGPEAERLEEEAARFQERVTYHARMERKYEWATWFPWLPLRADPPEPK
jgi:hypothetical protein